MTESEKYFNSIAHDYDFWKRKNGFYYSNLIELYRSLIPTGSTILEIGCGTGDIVTSLNSKSAKGIDISHEMIEIAKRKHVKDVSVVFEQQNIFSSEEVFDFDFIFLADVLEHIEDVQGFLNQLVKRVNIKTKVIISVANPRWEPILMLAEKMKLKMPEGPHNRVSITETEKMFTKANLNIMKKDYRLMIPKKIPGADWINNRFYKSKILARFGFIVYWVLVKKNEK